MPELPEVEVVRRGLEEHVVGREIVSAELFGARVARRHVPGPADLAARVTGARVEAADRRGKYLWLALADSRGAGAASPAGSSGGVAGSPAVTSPTAGSPAGGGGAALVIHLGMSGQLLVRPEGAPDERHLHARLRFPDGGPELRFVDQRTFGGMSLADLVPDPALGSSHGPGIPAPIVHIAPDPLEPAYDRDAVVARARLRRSEVKRVLLDQGVVSGIGNIYADEALWRARLHGARVADSLTRPVLRRVLDAAAEVMTEALGQGGTSFDALYVNVNGASGYFDRSLHAYGQEGRPCDRCGTPIRREAFANRSSFSCPVCQPRPRSRPAVRVGGAPVPRTGPSR